MSKSKSTLPTGKEVDTYLKASPLINKYIEDKLKQGLSAEGRLHILTPEQFRKKLVEYLQNFKNPETGSYYTAEEAEEEEAYMANFLVKTLPKCERAEARLLLVEQIFPKNLIGLSEHPKPCHLVEHVYEELALSLSESPKNQRLETLVAASCEAEIYEQSISSLSMAIARYAKQYPDAADEARDWLDPTNQRWLSISIPEFRCEASKRLEQLNRWQKWAKADHRTIWQAYRLKFIHSRFNLKSVKSGCFSTAMGSLADFLDSVGAEFDKPYLH